MSNKNPLQLSAIIVDDILAKAKELEDEKTKMVAYLNYKVEKEDWHGVADAAMDIREIEAKLDILSRVNITTGE